MKDNAIWVFQTFGFTSGVRFLWDSLKLKAKRLITGEKPPVFHKLTDEEAEEVTLRFTVPVVPERTVHNYDRTLN
jgi:hypothetical protein